MEEEITPRFHKIGESRKNLNLMKEESKKRRNSVEHLSKRKILKNKGNKKAKFSEKSKKIKIDEVNDINCIFLHKFILHNDFDKEHCKKFLKEKHVYMEKPILFDEICN